MAACACLQSDCPADPTGQPALDARAPVRPPSDARLTLSQGLATRGTGVATLSEAGIGEVRTNQSLSPWKPASRGRRPQLLIALLGVITLASVDLLLAQDGLPDWFPAHAHELLA